MHNIRERYRERYTEEMITMDNDQVGLPEFEMDTREERVWRVRRADGGFHYGMEPNPNGGSWVRTDSEELKAAMGRLGYSCLEEVPITGDNATERCERCGEVGVQYHHTAPKKVFGEDAESYPLVKLCTSCHDRWHKIMAARAHDYTVSQLKRFGHYKLASAVRNALNDLSGPALPSRR